MIKEKTVQLKWNAKNKQYYINLGYIFTKIGDCFEVEIKDLSKGSHVIVTALCDVCNKEIQMEYRTYLRLFNKNKGNIYCRKCSCNIYSQKLYKEKGVFNQFQLPEIKEKIKETNKIKYGVEYIMQSEQYKTEHLYGDKNHFWIDGRNSTTPDRNNSNHKKWHKKLLEIYQNRCFICNSEEDLECHHLYSFSDNLDLAYELENGVVLCKFHHKDFHKKYGYYCTYEDFIDYLIKTCRDYRKDMPFRDKGQNNQVE